MTNGKWPMSNNDQVRARTRGQNASSRGRKENWSAEVIIWCQEQTSYLSQISQIIFVEKNLSCGEISDFWKDFEQFMEFYLNLCHFCSKFVWRKICVEKKWQIWGLVKRCYKSCCVFIICKFQTAVEFGSSRVQRKQGSHLPDHQSSRVLNVTLITIACFFASNIFNRRPYFSCFRDGGKRFDAEFQGSHHQLDKQKNCHMTSKWKQITCKMNKMNA